MGHSRRREAPCALSVRLSEPLRSSSCPGVILTLQTAHRGRLRLQGRWSRASGLPKAHLSPQGLRQPTWAEDGP